MVGQFNQQFKQSSNNAKLFIGDVKSICIRIELVVHDAYVLSFQAIDYSLKTMRLGCIEQNELHFWKLYQGAISND